MNRREYGAIDYIGRHRKTPTRVGRGKPISTRMFNLLQRKHLVMWLDEGKREVMLTAEGERIWSRLHPHSIYRMR